MSWYSLGFSDCPFKTDPIENGTLDLFVGHVEKISACIELLKDKSIKMVIEGARGVGTTSFANYLRFNSQKSRYYFTPRSEIRVEPNWTTETLLAAIVSNVVREIEITQNKKIAKDKRFVSAKALTQRISDTYQSMGITAFGMGASYGKNINISQPVIVPSPIIGHQLEDLAVLVTELGYKNGLLIQLNNLDIGAIHSEEHLSYLFNMLRDYIQTPYTGWFLVGDENLRSFIARKVDRVDDIITYETIIKPVSKTDFHKLIKKRVEFYRKDENTTLPITKDVFDYLYDVTDGRLRYIFDLLNRIWSNLPIGDLINMLTLELAKPMITTLAKTRIKANKLSLGEEDILISIVKLKQAGVKELIDYTKKSRVFVSRTVNKLLELKLVNMTKEGTARIYAPELDAKIAYIN